MKDRLKSLVTGKPADYLEIRVEESQVTRIVFRGKDLETLGQSINYGGNVRALVNGGWGFVSFNSLDGLEAKVDLAIRQAALIGAASKEKVRLADVPVVEDVVRVEYARDPRSVSLEDKTNLFRGYNDIILSWGGKIRSSNVNYTDKHTVLYFANSEGTYIEQEKLDLSGGVSAIATEGSNTQIGRVGFGSSTDFGVAVGLEEKVREACKKAEALLAAPVIAGGEYTVICDRTLAGIFAHEAFGHLSEADSIAENEAMRETMKLGRKFGHDFLNIYDTGRDVGARGYLKYDDEGVATGKTPLIENGVLVGRLHSRESAAKMGEWPTGNARAIDYRFPPIVRMRNTCIAAGEASFEDMLAGVPLGVYCVNSYGGETNGEMFTFSAGEAYMIRDGKVAEMVRDVNLTGNVFRTLANIDMVGKDFCPHEGPGGCGKNGQGPLPTSEWAPHVRIQKVIIGGKK
ncbi:MAG: TldD/PmbA family protein [Chloroflexota bacterium]